MGSSLPSERRKALLVILASFLTLLIQTTSGLMTGNGAGAVFLSSTSHLCLHDDPNLIDAPGELHNSSIAMYKKWVQGLFADPLRTEAYKSNNESIWELFGAEHWGASAAKLTLSVKDPIGHLPTCSEIYDFQTDIRGARSLEGIDNDTAEIVLLVAKLEGLHSVVRTRHETTESAQRSVDHLVDSVILNDGPQSDSLIDAQCSVAKFRKLLAGMKMDLGIEITDAVLDYLFMICGGTGALPGATPEVAKAFNAVGAACGVVQKIWAEIKHALRLVKLSKQMNALRKELHEAEYQQAQAEAAQHNKDPSPFHLQYYTNVCAPKKDLNFGNSVRMKDFEHDRFVKYDGLNEKLWKRITHPATLDEALMSVELLEEIDSSVGQYLKEMEARTDTELEMDNKMFGYLASAVWRASNCAMQCQNDTHSHEFCTDDAVDQFRMCPEENVMCQVGCWTHLETGNHEVPLYGHEQLASKGFDLKAAMNASYWAQKIYGNPVETTYETDAFSDALMQALAPQNPSLQFSVCPSLNSKVRLLESTPDKDSWNFGCDCGNWMSDQMTNFLESQYMGRNSTHYSNGLARETFAGICMRKINYKPPLTHFFASCALGVDPDKELKEDPLCEPLRYQVKQEHLAEFDANTKFCSGHWDDANIVVQKHSKQDYRMRCEKFLNEENNGVFLGYKWDPTTDYSVLSKLGGGST